MRLENILKNLRIVLAGVFMLFGGSSAFGQTFQDASHLFPNQVPNDLALGASLIDVNSDGLIDVYRPKSLLIQQPDGSLVERLTALDLDEGTGVVFGAVLGDYNQDGFLDLFFMDLLEPSKLYRNQAGMRYVQANDETGIQDQQPVQGSIWTDFDQDGLLDLFVGIDLGMSHLFLNKTDYAFTDVSAQVGLGIQAVYGVAAADFDRDGDTDIFMTQCFVPEGSTKADNLLLQNNDGVLQNVSPQMGIVDDLGSWGTVWLDFNNDGWLDLYTINADQRNQFDTGRPGINTLYINNQGMSFTEIAAAAGVAGDSTNSSIAVSAADFDNDGWIDIIFAKAEEMPITLYRNNGDSTFTDIAAELNIDPTISRAIAVGDYNNDGWIDIYLPGLEQQLFLNDGGDNHFLKVQARGTFANLFGVGSRIELHAGDLHQVREIVAGDGFTSQNHNLTAHFGLGSYATVDSLIIRWPGGHVDRYFDVAGDQAITLVEGVGINNPPERFALLEPAGSLATADSVLFTWETAGDEAPESLFYNLHLSGPGLDTTIIDLQSDALKLSSSLFNQGETYRWTVSASDGYSVTGTDYLEFVLGNATFVDELSDYAHLVQIDAPHPNPFVILSYLSYRVLQAAPVDVSIYDALGRSVVQLKDAFHAPGTYEVVWDGRNQANKEVKPGVYFYRVTINDRVFSQPVVRR